MNRLTLTLTLACTVTLTACDKNPLQSQPQAEQVNALMQASRTAEKAMHLNSGTGGGYYPSCMGLNDAHIDCDLLFKLMVDELRTHRAFASIEVKQITDKSFYNPIALAYQQRVFNSIED
ncbi:hypothetical protein B1207_07600 [Legionella quinlivanii]|uniref:Legionella vir region protein n=1 Tax=Legionella quinlivanii TaxID=45073 RepID=A0A364LJJ5_9GAMM|nr:hypothetical protein [Legionella quinlivanii]RAP36659.1 hypothetical protein B1207_07600 [Legionella quinlivanii]